jgi:23S rRNA pseudouridine1911/1915/1917 synthase
VHRLDKDTSGALLLAKNPGSLVNLLHQFKTRQVTKQYLCLVHGKFGIPAATVSFPMGRGSHNRQVFTVRADGREAVTEYKVQGFYPQLAVEKVAAVLPATHHLDLKQLTKRFSIYQGFSLVECWPKTGRTHQIRVHMAHLKHPLVGDTTYVGKKRQALDPLWCPRQFLHASQLTFTHPRSGEVLTMAAPLAADLEKVVEYLVP